MIFRKYLRKNFWFLLVLAATAIHLAISLKLAIYWYDNFNLGKYDLGNAVQVVNNTLHGKFFTYTDRFGTQISRLSNHADFILLLLVPVFAIFPSPVTLIVAQCLALSLGGLVVYLLARAVKLSKFSAALISLAYLLNSDIGYLGLDAFHGITFAIPFVLLSFYFLECLESGKSKESERKLHSNLRKFRSYGILCRLRSAVVARLPARFDSAKRTRQRSRRYKKINWGFWNFLLSTFLILISKENASLLVTLLGFYAWLVKKQKKLGLALTGIGLGWFAIYFLVISPAYGPARQASVAQFVAQFPDLVSGVDYAAAVGENPFTSRYSHLGSTIKEIVLSPVLKPKVVAQGAFNWQYILRLLGPVGFLATLAPTALVIALPEYLINTLSSGGTMAQKYYGGFHYISLLIPVVFYAAILGIKKLETVVRNLKSQAQNPNKIQSPKLKKFGFGTWDFVEIWDLGFKVLGPFVIFSNSLFFAFREHNPILVNPITLASQRLGPSLQQIYNKYSCLLPQTTPEVGKVTPNPLVGQTPVTPSKPSSQTAPLLPQTAPLLPQTAHGPTVYIQNPKHSGGDAAVYELLKNQPGTMSGPSSLGAKLVVRENYNLFPVHWQNSQFAAANFTGAPKTFGSIKGVFGLGANISAVEFLRKTIWEVENDPNYGVLYSGNGLLVFERMATQLLFEYAPVIGRTEPIGTSRAVMLYNFDLPKEFVRGTAQPIEFGWEVDKNLVMEKSPKGRGQALEGAPFIAFCAEGDKVADFYEVLYGLFLSLGNTEGPQRVRQLITLPEKLKPGEYKVYFGWYELLDQEMPGHAKLKNTIKLGSVEVR